MAVREMAVDSSVSQAFENARKFLHPVLDRGLYFLLVRLFPFPEKGHMFRSG